jgi:hypothetical protein
MIMISRECIRVLKLTPGSGATALGSVIAADPSLIKLNHYERMGKDDPRNNTNGA